jgi:hypothetical protein
MTAACSVLAISSRVVALRSFDGQGFDHPERINSAKIKTPTNRTCPSRTSGAIGAGPRCFRW